MWYNDRSLILNFQTDQNVVAAQLGELICPPAVDLLLKECLVPAVPPNMADLEEFEAVLSSTKNFRSSLIDMKLSSKNSDHAHALLKFADNINETFISKRCTSILVQARKLMKKDLHNSVLVTGKSLSEALILATTNKRSFIPLPVLTWKLQAQNMLCTQIVFVLTFRTICVHNLFWACNFHVLNW